MRVSFTGILFLLACLLATHLVYTQDTTGQFKESVPDVAAEEADVVEDDGIRMDGLTKEDEAALDSTKESFVFQAEVNRLMDIIINSLYKNRYASLTLCYTMCMYLYVSLTLYTIYSM
jgi:hypothetical protein